MVFYAHEHLVPRSPIPFATTIYQLEKSSTYSMTCVSFKCEICKVAMKECDVNNHCKQHTHIARVQQIQKMQQKPMVVIVAALQHRIELLGIYAWQYEIQAKLYWILLYQGAYDGSDSISSTEAKKLLLEAEKLLVRFEQMERISLLKLAVWKAVCLAIPENTAAQKDYHSWQQWALAGWKTNKSTRRKANEIGIIVAAVLPFLAA
jgi:hypothetical protein